MNTSLVRTLVGLGLAFVGSESLKAQESIAKMNVPFDFVAGHRMLTAGEYKLSQAANGVLLIRRTDGSHGVLAPSIRTGEASLGSNGFVTFQRYGDRYFLSQMTLGNGGWKFFKSAEEQELARAALRAPVTVAASRPVKTARPVTLGLVASRP